MTYSEDPQQQPQYPAQPQQPQYPGQPQQPDYPSSAGQPYPSGQQPAGGQPYPSGQQPAGGQYLPPAPPPQQGYGYGQGYQPSVPPGMYLDNPSGLVLPQGTELASVGRRIGAYFLSIPLAIVTLGIGYAIWGLIIWGRGQTPALQVLGMRVWRPDSRRNASWGYMALREIVGRIVDGILSVITELVSFIMMLSGKERKTLHDLVAGTVVLHDPNKVLEPH